MSSSWQPRISITIYKEVNWRLLNKDIKEKHKETLQNIRVSNILIRAQTTEKLNETWKTVTQGCIKFKELLSAKGTNRQSAGQFHSGRLLFPVE